MPAQLITYDGFVSRCLAALLGIGLAACAAPVPRDMAPSATAAEAGSAAPAPEMIPPVAPGFDVRVFGGSWRRVGIPECRFTLTLTAAETGGTVLIEDCTDVRVAQAALWRFDGAQIELTTAAGEGLVRLVRTGEDTLAETPDSATALRLERAPVY